MVEQGLAQRNASGYVYVKFVAPTGSYNLLYEPMKKVYVNYKRGARITNHYVKEYRSLLGKHFSPDDVAYYQLAYMGSTTRAVKSGIGGRWTMFDPADSPTPGEDVERLWKLDRENRAHEAGVMARSEFFRGLVPFRNTIKYWNHNSAIENTLNLTGDVLLFLGPLSKVFAGANTARQVLRITIAGETALGVARAGQGVYDLTYGDGKNAPRFFGEAALRLLGVTASTIQLLKTPRVWTNHFPNAIEGEMAKAAELGVKPTKITGPASVREIGADGRVFKWVVSEDGELLGLPKLGEGDVFNGRAISGTDVIKHSVATKGRPVQAAGNARIQGDKVLIDRRSGHFRPDESSMQIAKKKFEAAGFQVEIVEGGVTPPSGP